MAPFSIHHEPAVNHSNLWSAVVKSSEDGMKVSQRWTQYWILIECALIFLSAIFTPKIPIPFNSCRLVNGLSCFAPPIMHTVQEDIQELFHQILVWHSMLNFLTLNKQSAQAEA